MIVYNKLFEILKSNGLKKTDLLEVITPATLSKLSRNKNVSVETLDKVCVFLKCQPGDILERINHDTDSTSVDDSSNNASEKNNQNGTDTIGFKEVTDTVLANFDYNSLQDDNFVHKIESEYGEDGLKKILRWGEMLGSYVCAERRKKCEEQTQHVMKILQESNILL